MPAASLAPLQSAPFRNLFLGATASRLGSAVAPIALAFGVLDLTHSASALGLVVGARSLANVVLLLFGGVLADRLPRGVVLVGSSLAAAASQAALAVVLAARVDALAVLVVLSALNGAASAFALPAAQALVPQTVPAAQLVPANALSRLGTNASSVVGTSLAGLLVVTLGSAWGVGLDAATYLVAAVFYSRIRTRAADRPGHTSVLRDLAEGWHGFRTRQWLWVVVAAFSVLNAAEVGAIAVLGPLFADAGIGRTAWGLALGAQTLGFVGGGLLALRWRAERLLLVGMLCMALVGLPLGAMALDVNAVVLVVAFFVSGVGLEQFGVAWQTALHQHVPTELMARVSSYDLLGSFVAIPVGQVVAGPVAHAVGLTAALGGAAGLAVAAALLTLVSPQVRGLRARTEPVPAAPA